MKRAKRNPNREDWAVLIAWLRELRHWDQTDLAREAEVGKDQICGYEQGEELRESTLDKILAAVNVPRAWAEALLPVIRLYRRKALGQEPAGAEPSPAGVVQASIAALESLLPSLLAGVGAPLEPPRPSLADHRREAEERFERLAQRTPAEREVLVDLSPRFRHWATVERLCEASRQAAAHAPREAEAWANLALRAAKLGSAGEVCPQRLEGYCLGHWANARRVANEPQDAERAVRQSWELWKELRDEFLDVSWLLGMEASLRMDQRRLPESLALLDRALPLAQSERTRASMLIAKANGLELLEDHEGALAALRQLGELSEVGDRQLLFQQRFAMVNNLGASGRYPEAEAFLPQVRGLALGMNNELLLARVLWLEGRIAAGLGRRTQAQAALEQVQRDFVARDLAHDAALVSLELGALYLEEDRLEAVRTLAVEMTPVFTSRQIHREALAALRLFCAATERGEITLQLTQRLVRYLEQARYDPGLPFQP
jgi:transcriptional regulator with XRE-family HTH domain